MPENKKSNWEISVSFLLKGSSFIILQKSIFHYFLLGIDCKNALTRSMLADKSNHEVGFITGMANEQSKNTFLTCFNVFNVGIT